jgi:hypothetical protein
MPHVLAVPPELAHGVRATGGPVLALGACPSEVVLGARPQELALGMAEVDAACGRGGGGGGFCFASWIGRGERRSEGQKQKKNDGPREGRARWGKETYCQVFSFLFVLE